MHRTLDIFTKDRVTPRVVQINADSPEHSLLIHSTPYREPIYIFLKYQPKRPDLEYDKFSWVKYSRLDTPEIVIESMMEPIF